MQALQQQRALKSVNEMADRCFDACITDFVGTRQLRSSEAEMQKEVRKLLRLLHPDFSINMALKGTKQHARIEAAFKKLSGLRDGLDV